MQSEFDTAKRMGKCFVCGTPVPYRDIRDLRTGKPVYCGRIHSQLARYATRHRGSNSGPMDRPTAEELLERTKWRS